MKKLVCALALVALYPINTIDMSLEWLVQKFMREPLCCDSPGTLIIGPVVMAQEKPKQGSQPTTVQLPPANTIPEPLNETQRLFLQNKMQAMEIAQLRFEAAKADLLAFLKTVEREGFDLDLQTGKYVPKPKTESKKE